MLKPRIGLKLVKSYSVQLVKEEMGRYESELFSDKEVFETLKPMTDKLDREHFFVIMLNTKNKMIGVSTVSVGSLASTPVHPREIFKVAILANAAQIVLAHNHPSGETEPSRQDIKITEQMIYAGKALGIPVIDHIIFGDGYHSMRASGDYFWEF